jgi:serine/threonine protein kinase
MASLNPISPLVQPQKQQVWAPPRKELSGFRLYVPNQFRPRPQERIYGATSLTKTATVNIQEVFDRIRLCEKELDKYGDVTEVGKGTFGRAFVPTKKPNLILKVQDTTRVIHRIVAEQEEAMLRRVKDVSDLPQLIDAFGTKHFRFFVMKNEGGNLFGKRFNLEKLTLLSIKWMQGLKSLHSRHIAHLDIKPTNLTRILIDLGGALEIPKGGLVGDVGTFSYKAPEIMMRAPFGLSADMWSLGCTLFELYTGKKLFPLENRGPDWQIAVNMIHACQSRLGSIPQNLKKRDLYTIEKGGEKKLKPDTNPFTLNKLAYDIRLSKGKEDSSARLEQFVDLLTRMLKFTPDQRITAEEALKHPFYNRSVEISSKTIVLEMRVRSASGAILQTIQPGKPSNIECLRTDFPVRLEYYHPEKPKITLIQRIIR